MVCSSKRAASRLRATFCLVVLLLLPLGLSGHHHAGDAPAANACATCVVVRHSPVVAAPSVAPIAVSFASLPLPAAPTPAPAGFDHSPQLGRAPPATLFATV
ncbi:MAG: hypothetical protein ACREQY_15045 [Candidatus Binatia bacterium]